MQVTILAGPMPRDGMGSSPLSRIHLCPRNEAAAPRRLPPPVPVLIPHPRFVISRLISPTATPKMLRKITPSTNTRLLLRSRPAPLVSLPSLCRNSRHWLGRMVSQSRLNRQITARLGRWFWIGLMVGYSAVRLLGYTRGVECGR
jgi:hypothetical protein